MQRQRSWVTGFPSVRLAPNLCHRGRLRGQLGDSSCTGPGSVPVGRCHCHTPVSQTSTPRLRLSRPHKQPVSETLRQLHVCSVCSRQDRRPTRTGNTQAQPPTEELRGPDPQSSWSITVPGFLQRTQDGNSRARPASAGFRVGNADQGPARRLRACAQASVPRARRAQGRGREHGGFPQAAHFEGRQQRAGTGH